MHADIEQIVDRYGRDHESLIPMLQDVQARYNYLPPDKLKALAQSLGISLSRVFSVATFYKAFSLEPRGKYVVHVCMGTACHVRGAPRILDGVKRKLGVESGHTTEDKLFTLETVNCLGSCALGPLVTVNEKYHGKVTSTKMDKILDSYVKAEGN